jgi:DNA-directed RNA polymerase specialized sigma24 family protein
MSTTFQRTPSLVTQLNREWASIAGRGIDCGRTGWRSGADLLAAIRQSNGPEQDALLHALLSRGRDGDAAAERVVLQVLIPAAQRMAQRVRGLEDLDRADRAGDAIGAAWESIRTYRLHLGERVMANLTMNMLRFLTPKPTANERLIAARTITVSDEFLEIVSAAWTPQPTPEVELANILAWAVDTRVLTRGEVALLVRAALGEQTHAVIAAELGLSLEGLRSRLTRIRKRLATAAQTEFVAA